MKHIRMFVLLALVLAGTLISIAPALASSMGPTHAVPGYVRDEKPTPTPIPQHTDGDPCSAGC